MKKPASILRFAAFVALITNTSVREKGAVKATEPDIGMALTGCHVCGPVLASRSVCAPTVLPESPYTLKSTELLPELLRPVSEPSRGPVCAPEPPKLLSENVIVRVPAPLEMACTPTSITGLVAVPKTGFVIPVVKTTVHTPTVVLTVTAPGAGFRSGGMLSTTTTVGFTPSEMVKVAAAFAQFANPAMANPAIKLRILLFI